MMSVRAFRESRLLGLVGLFFVCALLPGVAVASPAAEAALPRPSAELQPGDVVQIVIDALANNERPFPDAGIETAYNFASPTNRETAGSLDRFATVVKGPVFGMMINHRDSNLSQVVVEGDKALRLVQIIDADNETWYYAFRLGLQQDGDYAGMWLTEAVWPLENPADDMLAI